jgi:hypothetical protein
MFFKGAFLSYSEFPLQEVEGVKTLTPVLYKTPALSF